jgi:hypothetical protein
MYLQSVPKYTRFTFYLLCVAAPLLGASDRITRRIDPGRTATRQHVLHPRATAAADRGAAAPDLAIEGVTILFRPAAGLEALLVQQQLPGSRQFRRWLTPADLAKVTAWLESYGLHIDETARGRSSCSARCGWRRTEV